MSNLEKIVPVEQQPLLAWQYIVDMCPNQYVFLQDYILSEGRVTVGRVVGVTPSIDEYCTVLSALIEYDVDVFCVYTGTDVTKCVIGNASVVCTVYPIDTNLYDSISIREAYPTGSVIVIGTEQSGRVLAVLSNEVDINRIVSSLDQAGISYVCFRDK